MMTHIPKGKLTTTLAGFEQAAQQTSTYPTELKQEAFLPILWQTFHQLLAVHKLSSQN